MSNKLQKYVELARRTAEHVTDNSENWKDFLQVAAKVYRYSFSDQLLIYAQMYPSADVLVATKKDFEPANRKKFCSRIATGTSAIANLSGFLFRGGGRLHP